MSGPVSMRTGDCLQQVRRSWYITNHEVASVVYCPWYGKMNISLRSE